MLEFDKDEIIERIKSICGLADENTDTDYIVLLQDLSKRIKKAEEFDRKLKATISRIDIMRADGTPIYPKGYFEQLRQADMLMAEISREKPKEVLNKHYGKKRVKR